VQQGRRRAADPIAEFWSRRRAAIAGHVRDQRISRGWSQAKLAEELSLVTGGVVDLDPTAITRIESGERGLDAVELLGLARAFRIEERELVAAATAIDMHVSELSRIVQEIAEATDRLQELERMRTWHEQSIEELQAGAADDPDQAAVTKPKRGKR
jgi:transcriptional regulator with XRE-family HTH domain